MTPIKNRFLFPKAQAPLALLLFLPTTLFSPRKPPVIESFVTPHWCHPQQPPLFHIQLPPSTTITIAEPITTPASSMLLPNSLSTHPTPEPLLSSVHIPPLTPLVPRNRPIDPSTNHSRPSLPPHQPPPLTPVLPPTSTLQQPWLPQRDPATSPPASSSPAFRYTQPAHNPNNSGTSQLPNLSSPFQRLQPTAMAKTKTKRSRTKRRQTPPRAPTPLIPSSKASATTATTTAPSSSQESHGIGAQPDPLRPDPSVAAANESTSSNSSSSSSSSSSESNSNHDSKPAATTPAATTKAATNATTKAPQKRSPTTAKHASTPKEVSTGPHPANASFASGLSSNPFSVLADDAMSVAASDDATPTEVNILQGWSPEPLLPSRVAAAIRSLHKYYAFELNPTSEAVITDILLRADKVSPPPKRHTAVTPDRKPAAARATSTSKLPLAPPTHITTDTSTDTANQVIAQTPRMNPAHMHPTTPPSQKPSAPTPTYDLNPNAPYEKHGGSLTRRRFTGIYTHSHDEDTSNLDSDVKSIVQLALAHHTIHFPGGIPFKLWDITFKEQTASGPNKANRLTKYAVTFVPAITADQFDPELFTDACNLFVNSNMPGHSSQDPPLAPALASKASQQPLTTSPKPSSTTSAPSFNQQDPYALSISTEELFSDQVGIRVGYVSVPNTPHGASVLFLCTSTPGVFAAIMAAVNLGEAKKIPFLYGGVPLTPRPFPSPRDKAPLVAGIKRAMAALHDPLQHVSHTTTSVVVATAADEAALLAETPHLAYLTYNFDPGDPFPSSITLIFWADRHQMHVTERNLRAIIPPPPKPSLVAPPPPPPKSPATPKSPYLVNGLPAHMIPPPPKATPTPTTPITQHSQSQSQPKRPRATSPTTPPNCSHWPSRGLHVH
ncbi:unknown protein [Seminavis robusta]|uniref:Uncharacterized protein n=1 Tax=Seminavis robusta TaxID=568900 RepID=A0A9N8E7J7_9STRA|nr:unknown protein [Seminavis robusta]|eukprot:Sro768_g199630.1 n/a (894) ;mRNA; r:22299-25123